MRGEASAQDPANWSALLEWEDCTQLLGELCAEAGLPTTAEAFTDALRSKLTEQAATVDAGYPDNSDRRDASANVLLTLIVVAVYE